MTIYEHTYFWFDSVIIIRLVWISVWTLSNLCFSSKEKKKLNLGYVLFDIKQMKWIELNETEMIATKLNWTGLNWTELNWNE